MANFLYKGDLPDGLDLGPVVAIDSDLLVPREDLSELAVRAPDAWLQVIASRYGHDAFLKETAAITAALTAALDA